MKMNQQMKQQRSAPRGASWKDVARGFLMGGADVIPGVSGGTVALIVGVYERLVGALSNFDLTLVGYLRQRQWRAAMQHVDLAFLVALGSGVVLGISSLASTMNYLLAHHAVLTWACLFGMILGSSLLVARMVKPWSASAVAAAIVGTVFAYWLVGQLPTTPPPGYGYVFLCGAVAICAMILPGISGAFILVLMGMYFHITEVLKETLKGQITAEGVLTIFIFCSGCAIGLLSFSKFLRWLLNRQEALTMATLGGFMVGSLRKIWPFKQDVTTLDHLEQLGLPEEELALFQSAPDQLDLKYRLFENHLPPQLTAEVGAAVALAVLGVAVVLVLDYVSRASERVPPLEEASQS